MITNLAKLVDRGHHPWSSVHIPSYDIYIWDERNVTILSTTAEY